MEKIVNITDITADVFDYQDYSFSDASLITNYDIQTQFDPLKDNIEFSVYDLNDQLVSYISNFPRYSIIDGVVSVDPEKDLESQGITDGEYNLVYNFVSPILASTPQLSYYVSQVSADRTEIRLDTTSIPNDNVIFSAQELISNIQNSTGSYYDFYLNFGNNQLVIANNALLDTSSINNPTVLIKLYEPLPSQFDTNSVCWAVTQVGNSVAYNVQISFIFDSITRGIPLQGPNFNLNVSDKINNSTAYSSYNALTSTTSSYAQGTGSLQYQLNSLLVETRIEVNIDYSDYNNFIHFSSAQTRLENFYYKLQLLEEYTYSASLSDGSSSSSYYISSSNIVWQKKIDEIITGFDNYEYFLYYESGSTSWPKTGDTPPYTNVTTTSTTGLTWFVSQSLVAEDYDLENNNALVLAIPSYIREDSENAKFELFVEMVGQMFDNVFIYLQNITTKFDADNRLNYGVSKDLVADILRDAGITIYQNNFSSNDVYQALIGITPSGSLYNLPYTTTQYPVPTGSFLEYITTYVTASSTSSLMPTDDINKEQYKRIYHNLPLLLKKKGSVAGLRDLINTFGVPDTILRINEFGGKDKDKNTFDNWQDEYNYSFYTSGSSYITSSWELNADWGSAFDRPRAIELRFKTDGLINNTASLVTQSLWSLNTGTQLRLRYTGSGYTSGSYSGSIKDPYYQYALLEFIPNISSYPNQSASIYLPFYNGDWWSVLINKDAALEYFDVYAANKNYKGEDGNTISFQASSSVTSSDSTHWSTADISYFGSSSVSSKVFTGSYQEIRYYTSAVSKDNFDAYVMNPYSIESSEYLAFRAALGGELYTASVSIHPKVTGSWVTTSSFASNSTFYTASGGDYASNTEVIYFDQVPAGIQNAISQKVKTQNIVLPYSSSDSNIPNADTLSPYISVQQFPSISASYTRDIDYVEVGFSPQNEINEDINSTYGYFNIGELIGDPRFQSSSLVTYPDLDALRNRYFEKYINNYQEWDYIRLIQFFNNALFKTIQDFTPARTSLAAGIIIKNTVLDRNRYRTPQVNISESIAMVGSGATNVPYVVEDQTITGSIISGFITGSSGGSMPNLFGQTASVLDYNNVVNITQSWTGSTPSVSGPVAFTQNTQIEFYNGELSGSNKVVTNGDLNDCNVTLQQVVTLSGIVLDGSSPGGAVNYYIPSYYLKTDKVYYFTFTVTADAGNSYSGNIYLNQVNPQINLYSSPSIAAGNSLTVNTLQINYPVNPLNFFIQEALDPGVDTFTFTLDLTIFESYIEPDCLVIANDAQVARPSTLYFDVDYNVGNSIPVNQQNILSGQATPATVPDSYYTTARVANPRYWGCELTTYDSRSAAEGYTNYFGYFTYVTASARVPNPVGNVNLISLIDINGTPVSLDQSIGIGLNQNTFISGTLATVLFPTVTTGSPDTGSQYYVEVPGGFYGPGNQYPITESATNVGLDGWFVSPEISSNPGLIIPGNFNPSFTGSFTQLAQQAGFFRNL